MSVPSQPSDPQRRSTYSGASTPPPPAPDTGPSPPIIPQDELQDYPIPAQPEDPPPETVDSAPPRAPRLGQPPTRQTTRPQDRWPRFEPDRPAAPAAAGHLATQRPARRRLRSPRRPLQAFPTKRPAARLMPGRGLTCSGCAYLTCRCRLPQMARPRPARRNEP
jgi:hypothetical protein